MHRRAPFPVAGDQGLNDYLGPYAAAEQEQHQPLPPPQQVSVVGVIASNCRAEL